MRPMENLRIGLFAARRRSCRLTLLVLSLFITVHWATAAQQDVWTGVDQIVAVGDVHGDYDQFVSILRASGLLDSGGNWIGGKTHLVQTGDILDRGPDSRKVMDLLMDLEKKALTAGGYVHCLIGNHEAMNLYGDLRYVSPQEYQAFRTADSKKIQESQYKQHIEELKKSPPLSGLPSFDQAYRKEWESRHPIGYFEHRQAFGPNGKYGKWILRHNAIVRINDTLFLHGGLSAKYANQTVRKLNERIREELSDFSKLQNGVTLDNEGPLWYRGLAQNPEIALSQDLDKILEIYQCNRIVIGHTPTPGAVIPRFGGKVILIDVSLSASYGARNACLIVERDRPYALHRGKKLAIPVDTTEDEMLEYLRQAAALDPVPSPLEPIIKQLEGRLAVSVSRK